MRADHAALGVLALLLVAPLSSAQEAPSAQPRPGHRATAPPDLEFLEYLGSLVREGDGWVDPTDLRGPAEEETDRVADDAHREPAPQSSNRPQEQ